MKFRLRRGITIIVLIFHDILSSELDFDMSLRSTLIANVEGFKIQLYVGRTSRAGERTQRYGGKEED